MIYAIRALGTEYVKIGRAKSVGKRLKDLDTGCPHELHIEAIADWPEAHETAIHLYLEDHCQKLEWFKDSHRTKQVIEWLQQKDAGLRSFRVAFLEFTKHASLPSRSRRCVYRVCVRASLRDAIESVRNGGNLMLPRNKAPQQSPMRTR